MSVYIVKDSAVLHNGARYEEGSEIELKNEEVLPLKHLLVKKVEVKNDGNKNSGGK